MKLSILALICLLAVAYGYVNLEHTKGQDILKRLEEGTNDVYVIFFYVSGQKGGTHNVRTAEDEKEVIGRVLNRHPSFKYAKVNADSPDYADLVKACGVNTAELHESPSVLIIEGGIGVWVHGPQTINKIEEFAAEYEKRASKNHDNKF